MFAIIHCCLTIQMISSSSFILELLFLNVVRSSVLDSQRMLRFMQDILKTFSVSDAGNTTSFRGPPEPRLPSTALVVLQLVTTVDIFSHLMYTL